MLAWNPNADSQVLALVVAGDIVYAGGAFTSIGGTIQDCCLAALDTTTGLLKTGIINPTTNGYVQALFVSNNVLFVGGTFRCMNSLQPPPTCTGGVNRNYLAAFDLSGNLLNWNPTVNSQVNALTIAGTTIFAGGNFTCYGTTNAGPTCTGGTNRNYLVAIDVAANCLTAWSANCGPGSTNPLKTWNPAANNLVNAMGVIGSIIYAGGQFTTLAADTIGRNRIAAISVDGTVQAWDPNLSNYALAMATSGNTIYAGGAFNSINTVARNRLAAVSTAGELQAWAPNVNSTVNAIAASSTNIYIGGSFSQVNATPRSNMAAIAPDGTLLAFNPNANNSVLALTIANETLYAGGYFTLFAGATRNRLAAIDTTNNTLKSWNPNMDADVQTIAIDANTVYVGGQFTQLNAPATSCSTPGAVTRNRIAAISTTDGCTTSWNPDSNGSVRAITIVGAKVYTGGSFTMIGGSSQNYFASLDAGSGLRLLSPSATGSIYALASLNETIYIGGGFTTLNGQIRRYLGSANADGALLAMHPDADGYVYALHTAGNVLYVGGNFTRIGGLARNRFVMLNASDGSIIW